MVEQFGQSRYKLSNSNLDDDDDGVTEADYLLQKEWVLLWDERDYDVLR